GTGSAPFRAFTMRRQRTAAGSAGAAGDMVLFFGARTPESLPYFGPLNKVPGSVLKKHLVFSRVEGQPKEYVQDRMMAEQEALAEMLADPMLHVYICGLRGMEEGVEKSLLNIAESAGLPWETIREVMRDEGRYHVETY
ncbi:MAG: benzoyl-CoA oxygenase, partial [Roseivivax sp.]|nr:benzoyl-CoA oxygenase [Roseivivax sp.]